MTPNPSETTTARAPSRSPRLTALLVTLFLAGAGLGALAPSLIGQSTPTTVLAQDASTPAASPEPFAVCDDAANGAGAEPWVGDPDRLSTLTRALEGVTVVCWLLAHASGPPDSVAALHAARLRAYLRELVDTTVRGFLYEASGSVDADVLAGGVRIVRELGTTWQLPVVAIESGPDQWPAIGLDAVERLLAPSPAGPAIGVQ